jgi:hypothetical protein
MRLSVWPVNPPLVLVLDSTPFGEARHEPLSQTVLILEKLTIMRDLAITIAQAAHWLNCNDAEVQAHLTAGRLRPYSGRPSDPDKPISLNSTVILAESLPLSVGVFDIGERRESDMAPRSRPTLVGRDRPAPEIVRSRPGPIVERRPLRPIVGR